jgi:hypothetical protein
LNTATIHYAHHPHYGVTVTRMRKCSSFGLHQVQVALPSGMQILIPEWMLDEDRCHGMGIVEHPTLAIAALFALRELVDAGQWIGVSEMVVRRLIAQKSLPAKQIVKFAPWMIERSHLDLPSVRKEIRRVHEGRRTGWAVSEKQTGLFADSHEA